MSNTPNQRWYDPHTWSFAICLTATMILLVTITVFAVIFVASQLIQNTLVDQIGTGFESQAGIAKELTAAFLAGNAAELQVLALSETIKDNVEKCGNCFKT